MILLGIENQSGKKIDVGLK
jgi:hypothetical protein